MLDIWWSTHFLILKKKKKKQLQGEKIQTSVTPFGAWIYAINILTFSNEMQPLKSLEINVKRWGS